jgi:hypothetical protein
MILLSAESILRAQIIQKSWEDLNFRQKLLADPKAAIKEAFDVAIPDHLQLLAVEEKSDQFYLVLPPVPTDFISTKDIINKKTEPTMSVW